MLTPQNMRTNPSLDIWDSAALSEDITHMGDSQLERYVRKAFEGQQDLQFLPAPFWEYTFSHYEDERAYPTPGKFFAGLYTTLPSAIAGTFTKHDGQRLDFDPEYRRRFENVLLRLLEECVAVEGNPTETQLRTAQYVIDAVGDIRFSDGPNSPARQFGRLLDEKETESSNGGVSIAEVPGIVRKLQFPDKSNNPLFAEALKLKTDPRYVALNYTFI